MKQIKSYMLSPGAWLFIMILMITSCHKPKPSATPTIKKFIVASVTMTSATFSFDVANAESLSLNLDDSATINVSGTSYKIESLKPNTHHTIVLTAVNGEKTANATQTFTTSKSSLSISNFDTSNVTTTTAKFTWKVSSDMAITSQTLINDTTKESVDVTGKTDYTISNLLPSKTYSFTLKVKDETGNEVTAKMVGVLTRDKISDWASAPVVTYGDQFAIIGNALSSKLTITINNKSGSAKVLPSLTASFGSNGNAVKMIRHKLNGGDWVVVPVNNGVAVFQNLPLAAGQNTLESFFAIKTNPNVQSGSALSFSFNNMDDGEGSKIPEGGWKDAVAVGTVNSVTEPTVITTAWNGNMYVNATTIPPNMTNFSEGGLYQAINIRATGPAGARFKSIKLRNPYASFVGLEFDNSSWIYATKNSTYFTHVTNHIWSNEFIFLDLPNDYNNNIIETDGTSYNLYYIKCKLRNTSSTPLQTGDYTPGLTGLELVSKYDLVLVNSNGQVIDLSDVVVKQGDTVLQN